MRFLAAATLLAGLCPALPAAAAGDPASPDWPCIQRKVPHLSAAQLWDGPSLEGVADWRGDPVLTRLVPELAARRTPIETAAERIEAYAGSLTEAERDRKLTALFAGVLAEIDLQRSTLIDGIERYYRRQKEMAERVKARAAELSELRKKASTDESVRPRLAEVQDQYDWDARIYSERMESLGFVCETPVILEQRAFDLAREIRARMSE